MAIETRPDYGQGLSPVRIAALSPNAVGRAEILSPEIRERYLQYANSTWQGIRAMIYSETGLPADHLHYDAVDGKPAEGAYRIDKTNPTNIGFSLASVGAAAAMGFIPAPEAERRIDRTITTMANMMEDPEVFIPTGEGKGLFVNWVQPSTGRVLNQWPENGLPVKQHVSTVDHAWLIASSQLISTQFPQFRERVQSYLDRIDLPFMFDSKTGFFRGVYALNPPGFEGWEYDVMSEARMAYIVSGGDIPGLMSNLINRKSERSVFIDSKGQFGRATYGGTGFEMLWPSNWVPEGDLSEQWRQTIDATIQMQKDTGARNNGGHYGYSPGLGPDNRYHEFRVPESGENPDDYLFESVITISALVNMGLVEPVKTYLELLRIHQEFPGLIHADNGDGDTVNTQTGEVQRDQLLCNQATSLLACWNIVKDGELRKLFMKTAPPALQDIYRLPLWQ